jgi:hypothetical protein
MSKVTQKSGELSPLMPEDISTILNIIGFDASTLGHEYSVHSLGAHLT